MCFGELAVRKEASGFTSSELGNIPIFTELTELKSIESSCAVKLATGIVTE